MQWVAIGIGLVIVMALGAKRWVQMIRRQAIEQAQEEASLEKIRFLQRLDHELKNPLTAMQIALANLADVDDINKHHEIHTTMRGQILRMSRLIGDLRKLATLEKGLMEQVSVDVLDLLMEIVQIFEDNNDVSQRVFTTKLPANLPDIQGDRDLLQLAIFNILDNARKFTTQGDHITLSVEADDDWIAIKITDTGRGIPLVDLPHVLEDLYRSPDVQGLPGSGVGLALVRGIIEQHDGRVEIASEHKKGTTVTLYLPVS